MMPTPAARITAALAAHPQIAVHLAVVDPSLRSGQALDDDDAAMVEQVVEYVARRSEEKRAQEAKPPEPEKDEHRNYGSGSIVKRRNGRYQAAAYTDDGRRVTKTFDTRRQAEDWLTRTRAKRIEGTLEFVDQRMTTGELLDWWYQTYCSMRTTSTRKSYHWGIKVLAESLRSIPAALIRVDQVQRQINDLHEAGKATAPSRCSWSS